LKSSEVFIVLFLTVSFQRFLKIQF